ncbi:MAG: hypothetical protein ACI91B_004634, partial [Planctomycetota bacterium]
SSWLARTVREAKHGGCRPHREVVLRAPTQLRRRSIAVAAFTDSTWPARSRTTCSTAHRPRVSATAVVHAVERPGVALVRPKSPRASAIPRQGTAEPTWRSCGQYHGGPHWQGMGRSHTPGYSINGPASRMRRLAVITVPGQQTTFSHMTRVTILRAATRKMVLDLCHRWRAKTGARGLAREDVTSALAPY